MADFEELELKARREYAQLLRLHERLLVQVQRVLADLSSAQTENLVRDIKSRTGSAPELGEIQAAVEETVRSLKLSQSNIRNRLLEHHEAVHVEGAPDLPSHLQRFLAERAQSPGFTYEVEQDEVRGWVIRWKEYTQAGTVRGFGQFYERPYAYLDD